MFEWCLLYARRSHGESFYSWENHQSEEMISASNPLPAHRIPLKHAFQLDNIFDSMSRKWFPSWQNDVSLLKLVFQQLDSRLMFSVLFTPVR